MHVELGWRKPDIEQGFSNCLELMSIRVMVQRVGKPINQQETVLTWPEYGC